MYRTRTRQNLGRTKVIYFNNCTCFQILLYDVKPSPISPEHIPSPTNYPQSRDTCVHNFSFLVIFFLFQTLTSVINHTRVKAKLDISFIGLWNSISRTKLCFMYVFLYLKIICWNTVHLFSGLKKRISVHNHATAFWRPNWGCQRWATLADDLEVNSKCQSTSFASATAGPIIRRRFISSSKVPNPLLLWWNSSFFFKKCSLMKHFLEGSIL